MLVCDHLLDALQPIVDHVDDTARDYVYILHFTSLVVAVFLISSRTPVCISSYLARVVLYCANVISLRKLAVVELAQGYEPVV